MKGFFIKKFSLVTIPVLFMMLFAPYVSLASSLVNDYRSGQILAQTLIPANSPLNQSTTDYLNNRSQSQSNQNTNPDSNSTQNSQGDNNLPISGGGGTGLDNPLFGSDNQDPPTPNNPYSPNLEPLDLPNVPAYPFPTMTNEPMSAPGEFTSDLLTCSISNILSNAISQIIEQTVLAAFGVDKASREVPVKESSMRFKEVGMSINMFGVSVPIFPSWDSFAYCLANAAIVYIAHATIYWIRSGFSDKPAYVDDPIAFMEQIADFEFSNFTNGVVGALTCNGPFRIQVQNRLISNYNNSYLNYGRCLMNDRYGGRFDQFMAGDLFDFDIWFDYTQNPANNPIGSYYLAQEELSRRVSARQNSAMIELDWGRGYFSWKDSENPNKTVTPGQVIQAELENRLGLDENRLVLADEFDEVLNELVNYLVRWALNETVNLVSRD